MSFNALESPMYSLTEFAYCCEFSDGAVILDLRADAYLALNAEQLAPIRRKVCNWPDRYTRNQLPPSSDEVNVDALIASMVSRGVLAASATPLRIELPRMTPVTSAVSVNADFGKGFRIADVARFIASLLIVVFRRRRNLVPMIIWLRRARASVYSHDGTTSTFDTATLKSFLRLRILFYTARRRCLFDSLVLSVFLCKTGVPCSFVIGVSTKPFLAHAWVQIGETVLNDTAENVQLYTPIFSVDGHV